MVILSMFEDTDPDMLSLSVGDTQQWQTLGGIILNAQSLMFQLQLQFFFTEKQKRR